MWPDRAAARVMVAIRDQFQVKALVETGTAHGIGARYWAQHFKLVLSCDIDEKMISVAREKCLGLNVYIHQMPSPKFLEEVRETWSPMRTLKVVFLLDAHWYKNWPILEELRALKGWPQAIIVIHDFRVLGQSKLGYVSYNGQDLDWDYVKEDLLAVNPGFHFYHNTRQGCDIVTPAEVEAGKVPGLVWDAETQYVLEKVVWESELRAHRGILYAVPGPLPEGLGLKEIGEAGGGP